MFRKLYPTNDHESAPVKKSSSGVISFQTDKDEESLLVVGGVFERSPRYKQPGAQYTNSKTNESHIFNITTSEYIIVSYYQTSYSVFLCEDDHIICCLIVVLMNTNYNIIRSY